MDLHLTLLCKVLLIKHLLTSIFQQLFLDLIQLQIQLQLGAIMLA